MGFFTNLNLDAQTPPRTRPRVGEKQWAPAGVPTTRRKNVQRVLAPIVFLLALAALVAVGYYFFRILVLGG
ncbi:hypothetical protein O6R08_05060 [Cutibacterium equinum]|uniref:Uncharacterized protein n=1 Tax=Cutibacterium equinum TaxID=3016342 RepID=A0ABY7R0K8_9ACTN|nr:hypothetical protein [Cutibacterium equinum]WCC80829.1 hypothetical protein O6R08_05060 [Cutibacterium equinum]